MKAGSDQHDRELVARIARGDTAALVALYHAYRPRLHLFLARLGCPPEARDEVCNEAFYVVWKQAVRYDGSSRVSTWIFGIARRKGLKVLAGVARDGGRVADVPLETLPLAVEADETARLELRQWLSVCLAMLPAEQRMVLELSFLEGMSCREIAAVMGCPENTVKTRMFHARRKLRALLPVHGLAATGRERS